MAETDHHRPLRLLCGSCKRAGALSNGLHCLKQVVLTYLTDRGSLSSTLLSKRTRCTKARAKQVRLQPRPMRLEQLWDKPSEATPVSTEMRLVQGSGAGQFLIR